MNQPSAELDLDQYALIVSKAVKNMYIYRGIRSRIVSEAN